MKIDNGAVDSYAELSEKVSRLFLAAQRIAEQTPGFFDVKGPGAGDHASLAPLLDGARRS